MGGSACILTSAESYQTKELDRFVGDHCAVCNSVSNIYYTGEPIRDQVQDIIVIGVVPERQELLSIEGNDKKDHWIGKLSETKLRIKLHGL